MPLLPSEDHRAKIDGSAFERLVVEHLTEKGRGFQGFRIEHQELLVAPDGKYRIDITARFRQLGVDFLVLVECKDHARPVEREDVQVLVDKVRATSAQKAIFYATNGFQRGALEYARIHRVALVRIIEGKLVYETKSAYQSGARPSPPPWANIQPFVGQFIYIDGNAIHVSLIERGRPGALADYLASTE